MAFWLSSINLSRASWVWIFSPPRCAIRNLQRRLLTSCRSNFQICRSRQTTAENDGTLPRIFVNYACYTQIVSNTENNRIGPGHTSRRLKHSQTTLAKDTFATSCWISHFDHPCHMMEKLSLANFQQLLMVLVLLPAISIYSCGAKKTERSGESLPISPLHSLPCHSEFWILHILSFSSDSRSWIISFLRYYFLMISFCSFSPSHSLCSVDLLRRISFPLQEARQEASRLGRFLQFRVV
jgi:hypothetical protein